CAPPQCAHRLRRRGSTAVGTVSPHLRADRCRGHRRPRSGCGPHRRRLHARPRALGEKRSGAVLLASSPLEAPASGDAARAGRSAAVSRATQRLGSDRRAWFGGGTIVLLALMALAAPFVAGHDPFGIDLINSLQPPSPQHWFGTDIQGRDVWARLVYGARVSLSVGIISQGIALSLGVILGLLAGYYGKWVDEIVMRLADVTLAFPTLLLLIALVAALQPSLTVVFATIGLVGWA